MRLTNQIFYRQNDLAEKLRNPHKTVQQEAVLQSRSYRHSFRHKKTSKHAT